MIKSKSAKIILLTMTITAIVFLLKADVIADTDNQLRHLVTNQQIHDICNSAFGNKYTNLAMNYTQLFESKVASLGNIFIPAQNGDYQLIIDYIENTALTNNITKYALQRGTPYLIFIFFAIVSLITWIVLCICSCRPCWCCKKSENDGICKTITLILLVLCYSGVIIGSVIGFIYSVNFVEAMNGSSCAVMVFYADTINGQNTTATPRWIGINQISNALDSTITAINTIDANKAAAFPSSDDESGLLADFTDTLTSSYTQYDPSLSTSQLNNPNPQVSQTAGITKIMPLYINAYGDYNTPGTDLYSIYQEFNTKLQASYTIRTNAQGYVTDISNNANDVKQQITDIQQDIAGFQATFNTFSNSVITNWINVQTQIDNIGVIAFLILFAVLISMSVVSIFLLFCYGTCCKWQWLRFVMHFIWWLFSLIMILTFLIGGAFGIVGLIGEDGTPVLQWIFGTVNLESANPAIFGTGITPLYINTCVNLDGDLIANNISLDQYTHDLNLLYQASLTLQSTQTTLAGSGSSQAITTINTSYNAIINDITLTTDNTYGNNDISAILSQFRGWTDAGTNMYQKDCTPPTYDVWTHNPSKCPSGYNQGAGIGSQSCLLITGYTGTQAQTRYNTQSGCQNLGTQYFPSDSEAAKNYVTNLNQYIIDNTNLLNNLITQNGVLDDKFANISQKVIIFLGNMQGVITPLITIFESIVGNSGLFDIVNCGYMKTDLNNVYLSMQNDLAPKAFSLGGIIIAVSFLEYLSVICLFILINKFRKGEEGNNNGNGVILEMKEVHA